jgi:DNA-binding transcriptional MerR regulator
MTDLVNIAVLVKDTGEKARTLQHWSDLGILRPEANSDKRGRGYYREYKASPNFGERPWALIASALSQQRIPLGDVRHIIDQLRPYLVSPQASGVRQKQFEASALYQALTTDRDVILLLSVKRQQTGGLQLHISICPPIDPGLATLSDDSGEWKRQGPTIRGFMQQQMSYMRENSQACALNVTKIFSVLRGQ